MIMSKSSQAAADTCCSVCGQGFVLDWERQTKVERAQALQEIARTLRGHHAKLAGPDAHPPCGFLVRSRMAPSLFPALRFGVMHPVGHFRTVPQYL
jgi:hypothetical protein